MIGLPIQKSVMVTGASSGIGRACAIRLAHQGFRVFAGVRKQEDGMKLELAVGSNLFPVMLDVTDQKSIADVAGTVSTQLGSRGLDGLVNNAGIGFSGPLEYLPMEDLHAQYEVNVFGQVAVTQAFLPLIRKAAGRIINIGSVGDRMAIPFGASLCSSKSALASMTEALRMELHPWGIHVCLIEPGSISTPAVGKVTAQAERLFERLPAEAERLYGSMFRSFLHSMAEREKQGSSPDVVAEIISKALTNRKPRTRYTAGKDSWLLTALPRLLPDRLLDFLRLRLFGLPTSFASLAGRRPPQLSSRL
ncbi:MAG TPA: SDR family oxidoreductase [Bryobacteraceae bacterium]|nr:SDR family oxidoreductase [Bryobacteraceae bacterium]